MANKGCRHAVNLKKNNHPQVVQDIMPENSHVKERENERPVQCKLNRPGHSSSRAYILGMVIYRSGRADLAVQKILITFNRLARIVKHLTSGIPRTRKETVRLMPALITSQISYIMPYPKVTHTDASHDTARESSALGIPISEASDDIDERGRQA